MSDAETVSVIRRKLSALPAAPLGEAESAPIWREVLPKVSEAQFDLPLAVRSVRARRSDPDALIAEIAEGELVVSLRGDGGLSGIALVDPLVLAALIEALTLGEVLRDDPAPRKPTETDAALVGDALDAWIGAVAQDSGDVAGVLATSASAHLPGPRAARLSLTDDPLDVLTLWLDLGEGAREGKVVLAAPPGQRADSARGFLERPASLGAPVQLHAELARIDLPYSKVRDLEPGSSIDLPGEVIDGVRLKGDDGTVAATGRLGQSGGYRAIRLQTASEAPANDTEFTNGPPVADIPQPLLDEPPALEDLQPIADLPDLADAGSDGVLPDIGELPQIAELPDLT